MPKTITKYRNFTATDLKNRADIPIQANMVVSSNDVICSDLTISQIRSAINAADTNLSAIARHNNVNVWSGFGPTVRSVSNTGYHKVLTNLKPTSGYTMGSFAGYNHTATTPGWGTGKAAAEADVWVDSGSNAYFISDIIIGEVQYEGADGVMLVAFDSSSGVTAYGVEFLSNLTETANLAAVSVDTITTNTTWTLRSYLKTGTVASVLDVPGAIMYRCPNVDDATVNIKVKAATTYPTTVESPWYIQGSVGLNLTTGYYSWDGVASTLSYSNIIVYVTLYDWYDDIVFEGELYNGAYTADTFIYSSVYLGLAPISNYGYTVIVSYVE